MVRKRRRFGTDSDGQAERCRAAPMWVSASGVGRVGGEGSEQTRLRWHPRGEQLGMCCAGVFGVELGEYLVDE